MCFAQFVQKDLSFLCCMRSKHQGSPGQFRCMANACGRLLGHLGDIYFALQSLVVCISLRFPVFCTVRAQRLVNSVLHVLQAPRLSGTVSLHGRCVWPTCASFRAHLFCMAVACDSQFLLVSSLLHSSCAKSCQFCVACGRTQDSFVAWRMLVADPWDN
jgi:hypothetical protein